MIQASELRIGNLVGIKESAIHANGCNHMEAIFEIEEIRNESVHFKGFAYGEFLKNLKPLPLTEESLLRIGFVNTQIGLFEMKVLNYGKINIHITKKRLLVELGTTGSYLFGETKIQHLHQIQNLIFALTLTTATAN